MLPRHRPASNTLHCCGCRFRLGRTGVGCSACSGFSPSARRCVTRARRSDTSQCGGSGTDCPSDVMSLATATTLFEEADRDERAGRLDDALSRYERGIAILLDLIKVTPNPVTLRKHAEHFLSRAEAVKARHSPPTVVCSSCTFSYRVVSCRDGRSRGPDRYQCREASRFRPRPDPNRNRQCRRSRPLVALRSVQLPDREATGRQPDRHSRRQVRLVV